MGAIAVAVAIGVHQIVVLEFWVFSLDFFLV